MTSFKTAVLFVAFLFVSTSLGCASSPQESSESDAQATQTSEAADESSAEDGESASGPLISNEYADGSPPEMPEGCKVDKTSSSTMFQCRNLGVLMTLPLPGDGQEAGQAVLERQKQARMSAGWSVEEDGVETMDVDGVSVELNRYKITYEESQSAYVGGVVNFAQLGGPRVVSCSPNYGRPFDTARCAELFELLTKYVSATRVTGVLVNGVPVEFGEDCFVREGSVRCGKTVLKWTQYDGEAATEVPAPEVVAKKVRDRGVDVDLESVPCTLAGKARECAVMKLSAASYPDQAVVFMDAEREGRTLRLTCDIVEPSDPFALPEPCDKVMDVDFEKSGAE